MISKGKRKNVMRALESRRWAGLTEKQKQGELMAIINRSLNSIAAHYQIPVRMLTGRAKEDIQEDL